MSFSGRAVVLSFSVLAASLLPLTASAQTPALINYQGRLLNGTNLVNGNVGLSLRLFDASASGTLLYEDSNTVAAADGLYATLLGDNTTFGNLQSALETTNVWVEVAVNNTALSPRERLVSAAYAVKSRATEVFTGTVADGQLSANIARLNGTNQTFSGPVVFSSASNTFTGTFSGNGAGVSNVDLRAADTRGLIGWTTNWGTFALDSTCGVGMSPDYLVAADVNGDGKVDLISANNVDGTLSVLTNGGSGRFTLSSSPVVGASPVSLVAVDVNGDGPVDLVSVNYGLGTLTVLTNNGGGSFFSNATHTLSGEPESVAVADVNGDGSADLISANYSGNTLSVLTNNGSGGFTLSSSFGVGINPAFVIAADVNGDGWADLISANSGGSTLSILTNSTGNGFSLSSSPAVDATPVSLVATDVNGDGRMDLISANNSADTFSVLTNNGAGGFALATNRAVGDHPLSIAAVDVNGDGKPDLIGGNVGTNALSVLMNNGGGTAFARTDYGLSGGPHWVVAADVNGDGRIDLIGANGFPANSISVLLNMPTLAGAFIGNGGGLTGIPASALAASLSTNIAFLSGTNQTFSAPVVFSSASNLFTGSYSGNGTALSNVDASTVGGVGLTGIVQFSTRSVTSVYAAAGLYTFTNSFSDLVVTAKIWGAGGAGSSSPFGKGGGGAFAQVAIALTNRQILTLVVGEGGGYQTNLGGASSAILPGGMGMSGGGQGGQASLLCVSPAGYYVVKAIAGGGGGSGNIRDGGSGGNPGGSGLRLYTNDFSGGAGGASGTGGAGGGTISIGTTGGTVSTNVFLAGVASLTSLGGGGGSAASFLNAAGGGGGGWGGGGGGGFDGSFSGGGGGGGSYGDLVVGGTNGSAGNFSDSAYRNSAGKGGDNAHNGSNGLVVLIYPVPSLPAYDAAKLTNLDGGQLQASTVSGDKLATGTLSNAHFAASSITGNKLVSGTLSNALFAADSISGDKIADGSISNADIAANAGITGNKLAAGSLSNANYAAGSISGDKIAVQGVYDSNLSTNVALLNTGTYPDSRLSTNMARLDAGTYPDARLSTNVALLNTGTYPDARLSTNVALLNSGVYPDGRLSTNIARLDAGTYPDARLSTNVAVLNAGTYPDARLSTNIARLDAGAYPDARLSTNVALRNAGQSFSGTNSFLDRVGIGTTNPTAPLHVKGDVFVAGTNYSASGHSARLMLGDSNQYIRAVYSGGLRLGTYNAADALVVQESTGNIGIGTTNPTNKLHVVGTVQATAYITGSDRNSKESIEPVSVDEILAKVSALPLATWRFKHDATGTHLGPMAQDFHAAFGLGNTESGIFTVDADGVALAAIQALAADCRAQRSAFSVQQEKIKAIEAENAALKRQNEEILQRLHALEAK